MIIITITIIILVFYHNENKYSIAILRKLLGIIIMNNQCYNGLKDRLYITQEVGDNGSKNTL